MGEKSPKPTELSVLSRLRRFCFLGSFEPVYVHSSKPVDVPSLFYVIEVLVRDIKADDFSNFIFGLLHEANLVRKDETLMVLASYLSSSMYDDQKTAVRLLFPNLIKSADELFLFCKYTAMIAKEKGRNIFSRTVRKAIKSWYEKKSPEDICAMWSENRGLHGFTHRALMKLCHISDSTIGPKDLVTAFFKSCKDIFKENEKFAPENLEYSPSKSTYYGKIVAVSELRNTNNTRDAKNIIRKYKLKYCHVPAYLLKHASIMLDVLPSMSYLQLLRSWRKIARLHHFGNKIFINAFKQRMNDRNLVNEQNIHPIHFLMALCRVLFKEERMRSNKSTNLELDYLKQLYEDSFNWNTNRGKLRMHITVNLQSNYKRKTLKNHRRLSYYDACRALSFGFFKKQAQVDIFHWIEDDQLLNKIDLRSGCTKDEAFLKYDIVQNDRNKQRLVVPILNALSSKKKYDVFLCIVPTAGRGNPKQKSDLLCETLDNYRKSMNPNARFIILDLLKHRRSMKYSRKHAQHIFEICGLDDHTIDLIDSFAHGHFQ